MNFSTDRDLLAYEPTLFQDVPWVGQRRLSIDDGILTRTSLTSVSADFEAAQVEAGSVVQIERVPYEVIARDDAGTLTVSLLRNSLLDDPLPGEDGGPFRVVFRTFAPQAAQVHDMLLRMLGVDPPSEDPHSLNEEAVVSLSVMSRLEALGTLERVYSAASAVTGDSKGLLDKASHYRRSFQQAIRSSSVLLDTNGDGHADERRRLGVLRLHRV